MKDYLEDLIERMVFTDPPRTNSVDRVSFQSRREAEVIEDADLLELAKLAVQKETKSDRKRAYYFLIGKIAKNLECQTRATFLISEIKASKTIAVHAAILDRLADLAKPAGTDLGPILEGVKHQKWQIRHPAIEALKHTNSPEAEAALITLLKSTTDRHDIIYTNMVLSQIGTANALEALEPFLTSRSTDIRNTALSATKAITERLHLA